MTRTSTEQERAEFEARFNHLDLTQEPDSWGAPRYKHDAISLAWEAWQTARRAQATEPVAWLSPWRKDQVTTDYDAYGKQGIPLYAAPQPVAREPLTNAQREKIIEAVDWYNFPQDVIDAVERAHGIKGGQHGTESST